MNRLPGEVGQSLALFKNLPVISKAQSMPPLVRNLFLGQLAFFGLYSVVSGPSQMKLKRYFTVSPDSGIQSLATFHLCHTSPWALALNLGVLGSLGAYQCKTFGAGSFIRVFGLGCALASVAVASDAMTNPQQVQAGSLGASAALLSYTCFRNPAYFGLIRVQPLTLTALALAYAIYFDDKAVVGGLTAGYAAFFLAL